MTEQIFDRPEAEQPNSEINPKIGWLISVIDEAQTAAIIRHGVPFDQIKQDADFSGDKSRLVDVINQAIGVVGTEEQYTADYELWNQTKETGSHHMDFDDWRIVKKDAERRESERLRRQTD